MRKQFKKCILCTALLLVTSFSFGADVVVIRIYEVCSACAGNPRIVIEGTEQKIVPLEKYDFRKTGEDSNQKLIQEALKEYYDKGYKIESSVANSSTALMITTYVLIK
jgi:hypothetical protein